MFDSIIIENLISFRSKKSNYNDREWWLKSERKSEKRNSKSGTVNTLQLNCIGSY